MAIEQLQIKEMLRAEQTRLTLDEYYDYDDLPVVQPVKLSAYVALNTTGLTITGVYIATVEEPCDRCLEPYHREIRERFEDKFVYDTLTDEYSYSEKELQADDFYDTVNPDGALDVRDLVRQHLIIALSSDRVCEQDDCEIKQQTS